MVGEETHHAIQETETPLALIVEDDPATRVLEEILLEADGFAGLTAKNGDGGTGWHANGVRRSSCWTCPCRLHLASVLTTLTGASSSGRAATDCGADGPARQTGCRRSG
jgi:hypothetical protein